MNTRIISAALLLMLTMPAAAQKRKQHGLPQRHVKAHLPGSPQALDSFISATLRYPAEAVEQGVEGGSVVRFLVDRKGAVSRIHILRSSGSAILDAEAMRVVGLMPRWIPEQREGRNVRVLRILPIVFVLDH